MKAKLLFLTASLFMIILNLNCQWQTNGDTIYTNSGTVKLGSISSKSQVAKLNVQGIINVEPSSIAAYGSWGTQLLLNSTSLTGGQQFTISSLGGNANEGQGKLLIRNKEYNNYTAVLLLDSIGNFGIGTEYPSAKLQVKDGDIYIENINKGIIMKSPNGQCWRGTMDNTGNLQFSGVDCPETLITQTKDLKRESKATIYPNPSENKITIGVENYKGEFLTVLLTDLNGQIIKKQPVNSILTSIDISNITSGLYLVSIVDNNDKFITSEKIVKK